MSNFEYQNRTVSEVIADTVYGSFGKLLKQGAIVSGSRSSNPRKTEIYHKLQRLLRNHYLQYCAQKQGGVDSFVDRMEYYKKQYEDGKISEADFIVLEQNLVAKLEEFNNKIIDKFKQTNDKVNLHSRDSEADAERFSEMRDAHLKIRYGYLFLALAPLMPIPYLDPLFNMLSTIFDPNLTFGEAMSNLVKSDTMWIFGDFLDLIQFDELVRLIFDELPIVSDVIDVTEDIAESSPVYDTAELVKPALQSNLTYVPVAVYAGMSLIDKELALRNTRIAMWDKRKLAMDKTFREASDSLAKVFEDVATSEINSEFNALFKATMLKKVANFIINNSPEKKPAYFVEKVFSGMSSLKGVDGTDESKLYQTLFSLSEKDAQEAFKRVVAFEEIRMEKLYQQAKDLSISKPDIIIKTPRGDFYFDHLMSFFDDAKSFQRNFFEKLDQNQRDSFFQALKDNAVYDNALKSASQEFDKLLENSKKGLDEYTKTHFEDRKKEFASLVVEKNIDDFRRHQDFSKLDQDDPKFYEKVQEIYQNICQPSLLRNVYRSRPPQGSLPLADEVGRGLRPFRLTGDPQAEDISSLRNHISQHNPTLRKILDSKKPKSADSGAPPDLAKLMESFSKGGGNAR